MKFFFLIVLFLSCESRQVPLQKCGDSYSFITEDKEKLEKKLVENEDKVFDLQEKTDEGCKL